MDFDSELQRLFKQATELRAQGKTAESELLEAQAAAILKQMKTYVEEHPQDPATASLLLSLAERDWALNGDPSNALSMMQQAIALRETHLGVGHSETADALVKLAEIHYVSGRFETAIPLYSRALEIYKKNKLAAGAFVGLAFQGMAQSLAALGRTEEADPYFSEAIERVPQDDQGARSLYFLLIYRAEGLEKLKKMPEAESLRQRAATLLPKTNPGEFGFHT